MEEFLKHYIEQGVDHFYIINNNSDDNIEEVIDQSIYKSNVTLITDNRDMNILKNDSSPYGHKTLLDENLYDLIKAETKWAILIDADEFIYGKNGHTIQSYLSTLDEEVGCIYVIWNIINPCVDIDGNMVGDFSLKRTFKRLNHDLIHSLPSRAVEANDFGKSIVRTSMLIDDNKLWLHKIVVSGRTINNYGSVLTLPYDNGNNIQYSEQAYQELNISLNHHAIRNAKDYEKKKNQIDAVVHKNHFIRGLFDIVDLDAGCFIDFSYR